MQKKVVIDIASPKMLENLFLNDKTLVTDLGINAQVCQDESDYVVAPLYVHTKVPPLSVLPFSKLLPLQRPSDTSQLSTAALSNMFNPSTGCHPLEQQEQT